MILGFAFACVFGFAAAAPALFAWAPGSTFVRQESRSKLDELKERYESEVDVWRLNAADPKAREELRPDRASYSREALGLAALGEEDEIALPALLWAAELGPGPERGAALAELLTRYLERREIAAVFKGRIGEGTPGGRRFCETVLAKSPWHDVRGLAAYRLAELIGPALERRYTDLLQEVVEDFADVSFENRTLGEAAVGDLYELRHLMVGRPAPELKGTDVDGGELSLGDYRGKVVLVLFWGFW